MSFISPIPIAPGETIRESLEVLTMTQKELSIRLDISQKHMSSLLSGYSPITPEISIKLEQIIGGSVQFWLNLERNYQLSKLKIAEEGQCQKSLEYTKKFSCYVELAKAGFVKPVRKAEEKMKELLNFFRLPNFESLFELYPEVAYRNADNTLNRESLVAWLRCGDILAENIKLKPFNKKELESLIPSFKELTHCPESFGKKLQKLCAEVGVAVVFVPYFKNTKVNGATRWIHKNKHPLIQLNTKGASSDIFWFTFFHELGHVLKHGKTERFLESGSGLDIDTKKEKEADDFAEELLIPKNEFEEFINKNSPIKAQDIQIASIKWNIHPSIVRGRLAKRRIIRWSQFPEYRIQLKLS